MLEERKHQFFGFVVILLSVGFLNYFRRIANGYKFSKTQKILYLSTMIIFVVSIMFVLYLTNVSNIVSFLIGLGVAVLSEYIAKFFITLGDNFNPLMVRIIKFIFKIDLSKDLSDKQKDDSKPNKKHVK